MGKKRSWNEMTAQQKTGIIIGAIVQITLAALALRDLRRRPAALVRGPKKLWYAICAVNFIGPLAYFSVGRLRAPIA